MAAVVLSCMYEFGSICVFINATYNEMTTGCRYDICNISLYANNVKQIFQEDRLTRFRLFIVMNMTVLYPFRWFVEHIVVSVAKYLQLLNY